MPNFKGSSSVYSSHGVPPSLLKQLHHVFCGSGVSFSKSDDAIRGYLNLALRLDSFLETLFLAVSVTELNLHCKLGMWSLKEMGIYQQAGSNKRY